MSIESGTTTTVRGRVRVERGAKRIRAYIAGELIADTTRPLLVWEKPAYPTYYSPLADVREELLAPDGGVTHSPSRGDGRTFTVEAGGEARPGAAVRYDQSAFEDLREAIRFDWQAIDAWFEEDERVFTHPRDPYTRIDILQSSRHVRIEYAGVTIAETDKPTLLFETGLPVRYYLPQTHVRMDLLEASDRVSHCPYKGDAGHWSLRDGSEADLAWSYQAPLPESQKIAGLISFYGAKVDVYVDGVEQT